MRLRLLALALAGAAATGLAARQAPADTANPVRAAYTKYEHMIPMRDGVKLFTSVYVPKDCAAPNPILMQRTPYSVAPYGIDNYRTNIGPSELFLKEGVIAVYQDVRGRYLSEGEWVEVRPHNPKKTARTDIDESTDTWDTIDWLVKNVPCNNGRVGMWGISYPGFYVSAGMIDAHPALKAASPQAPVTDYFLGDDSFHNGAFMLAANFGFYVNFPVRGAPTRPDNSPAFNFGTPDGYEFYRQMGPLLSGAARYGLAENPYYRQNLDHTSYDDFWKARAIWRNFKGITPAVLSVGGWFDAEDIAGPLRTDRTLGSDSPATEHHLVMGPWTHGGFARGDGRAVGNVDFGQATSAWYREHVEFPFFMRHLKGKTLEPVAAATMFETGTNRWRTFDAWPPATTPRTMYLKAGGALDTTAATDADAFDQYVSDPNKPVPYVGHVQMGMQRDYMTEDQRFAATRPDVLVYATPPLDDDLTVLGPIGVDLHVSTSGTDSDFVVKVIDVYPNDAPTPEWKGPGPEPANRVHMAGYQQLVRGEPFRGKFRQGFDKPTPFVPDQPDRIHFDLPDVAHTFRRGHRLMVQVQSSWFPLVDRNPQVFTDIPKARPEDFRAATERVYRSRARASAITLPVEKP